ncbi:MAG: DNA (cytosine-5-)-methyltransferase [Thermoleophilia bacterium]|nr:DNA (cytosine-5-)-methyltransferase [Thermoleophilia bacterium]
MQASPPIRSIDLFAGIGGIRLGFESIGARTVFASEWDTAAQDVYEANFGMRPHGDITRIAPHEIPDHDVLLAGFPCQPFSIIGDGKGFADTRGTLFFSIEKILHAKQPAAFLLENVKQLRGHDGGRTLEVILEKLDLAGYDVHVQVLNALEFGVPQKRERIFLVGFRRDIPLSEPFVFPSGGVEMTPLDAILENDDDVAPSFFASGAVRESVQGRLRVEPPVPSIWHENKSGNISPLPYSCALRAGASYNYLLVNGIRRLTPREMLRLQGFPDSYRYDVTSVAQIRKQCGNSVAVPVIRAVAEQMARALGWNAQPVHASLESGVLVGT